MLVLLVGCLIQSPVQAQSFLLDYDVVYRPSTVRYQMFRSPHFDVIFQEGAEAEAREAAAILEAELPRTQHLIGARRGLHMPVVLNQFNDVSNGFVTAFPFKQEIEGVDIKGSRLSAGYPSWMWAVAPHELVHAVQAQSGRGFGVGEVLRWFAPDLTRSLNLFLPLGITEGAAVYHESRVKEGAGRLHFSLFQMQFRAAMTAKRPWSLAQLLEVPTYARPSNRFYLGGAHLFQYLAEQDEARFFRRALAWHYRFPFLGHGVELWYGTGVWPARLGRRFRAEMQRREETRIAALGPLTEPRLLAEGPGRQHRRPRWLNDSTLVAYVLGYDVRRGFYRIDARTGQRTVISHQSITEDFYYSLRSDGSTLLFSRYVRDPLVAIKALADVFALDLATGRSTALTWGGRVFAPVEAHSAVWALQNDGQFNQWVRLLAGQNPVPVTASRRVTFLELAASPVEGGVIAVLVRIDGQQGLFRATLGSDGRPVLTPWLFLDDASIHDVAWGAAGRYVLFTADPGGVPNIFAYDLQTDRVLKLTNVAFGALEPSLSPDGRILAFVQYRHEQYDLVLLPFRPDEAEEEPRSRRALGPQLSRAQVLNDRAALSFQKGTVRPYRALRHLKPRMLYPTARYQHIDVQPGDTDLGLGVGLALQGADPLERWAYGGEAFYQDARLWGRWTMATARQLFRPSLSLYDVPSTVLASVTDEAGDVVGVRRIGREERGVSLHLRLPLTLRSNVYTTTARVALLGELEQERLFDAAGRTIGVPGREGEPLGSFRTRFRLTPSGLLAYRVQSNQRDLLPNTGTVLTSSASLDAWREGGGRRRGVITQLTQYRSLSLQRHTGVQVQIGWLTQNQGSIYTLDRFLPRGYENTFLGNGSFLRLNLEWVQPLWFIENGGVIVPVYFKALYAYGFGETLFPLTAQETYAWARRSSVGAGLGLQFRVYYLFNLDVRLGASYLLEADRWDVTYR